MSIEAFALGVAGSVGAVLLGIAAVLTYRLTSKTTPQTSLASVITALTMEVTRCQSEAISLRDRLGDCETQLEWIRSWLGGRAIPPMPDNFRSKVNDEDSGLDRGRYERGR